MVQSAKQMGWVMMISLASFMSRHFTVKGPVKWHSRGDLVELYVLAEVKGIVFYS